MTERSTRFPTATAWTDSFDHRALHATRVEADAAHRSQQNNQTQMGRPALRFFWVSSRLANPLQVEFIGISANVVD
jgi:hypothetical protein